MAFVTVVSEALPAAASQLEGIGSAMTAQSAATAAPTTGVIPAAADQVSTLQAMLFSSYGSLYQQISAQATAIHEMFVNTLATSGASYGTTEAANQVAAGSSSGTSGILGGLLGAGSSSSGSSGLGGLLGGTGPGGLSGNLANIANIGAGNWASAGSDLIGLAGGGLLDAPAEAVAEVGAADVGLAGLVGAVGPVSPAGIGAAPVLANLAQASSVGGLSVPPSWAGEVASAVGPAPATLAGAGWTTAAPHSTPVATIPAGMPSVATAGKAAGFGAPRYGLKPTVMPKPAVV
ncbi:PPE family protein, SVP subgroup [Mycobacterium sp.]|uniref:PPE family protein, SVP subgroup n=1 Tax=Mycobacterium sp. TaxID=1785 RepID=UPI003D6BE58E